MKIGIQVAGSANVKIRNHVPVIRHWRLVWEIRESPPKRYDLNRAPSWFEIGINETIHMLDLGPVEVGVSVVEEPVDGGGKDLFVRLSATALDGAVILGSIEKNVGEIVRNATGAGVGANGPVFVWKLRASARGVDAELDVAVLLA